MQEIAHRMVKSTSKNFKIIFLKNKKDKMEYVSSCNSDIKANLPIWNLNIKNINISTLLGTGAIISLLAPELFDKIKETNIKIKYLSNNVRISTINNREDPFKHCVQFKFIINNLFLNGII